MKSAMPKRRYTCTQIFLASKQFYFVSHGFFWSQMGSVAVLGSIVLLSSLASVVLLPVFYRFAGFCRLVIGLSRLGLAGSVV